MLARIGTSRKLFFSCKNFVKTKLNDVYVYALMIRCLNLGFNYNFLNMLSRSSVVSALDSGAGNWGSITYKVAVPNVDVLSDSCCRFLPA
jgi:hypothetical protein